MTSAEAAKRRAYLLGLLADEEATQLEQQYFADESAFEELTLVEDDLLDEYLDGRLPDEERRALESCLKNRPALAKRLEARRTLTRALRRRAEGVRAGDVPRLGRRRVILGLAAAAAAVFVTVRALQEPPPASPRVASRPAGASLGASKSSAPSVVLLLGTAGVREPSAAPTAKLAPETPALRVRLAAPATDRPLDALVEDVDGGTVWRGAARIVLDGGVAHVEAEIPSSALRAGDYIVRYRGLPDGEEEAFFRVRR